MALFILTPANLLGFISSGHWLIDDRWLRLWLGILGYSLLIPVWLWLAYRAGGLKSHRPVVLVGLFVLGASGVGVWVLNSLGLGNFLLAVIILLFCLHPLHMTYSLWAVGMMYGSHLGPMDAWLYEAMPLLIGALPVLLLLSWLAGVHRAKKRSTRS